MKTAAITPMPAAAPARQVRVMRVVTPTLFTLDIRGQQFSDLTLSEIIELHQMTGMALETSRQPNSHLAAVFGVVAAVVCAEYDVHVDRLTQRIRTARYVFPRQVAMLLVREQFAGNEPLFSLKNIGEIFKRDHGTVMHAIRAVEAAEQTQPQFRHRLQKLRTAVATALQTHKHKL